MEGLFLDISFSEFARLFIAAVLGIILGLERVFARKVAGMRTYALVSLGAASFIITAEVMTSRYHALGLVDFDPLRVMSQVVVGIGFLGAGLIVFRDSRVRNLTTAAGLWVAASIGIATGFGLYSIAIAVTVITLMIFTLMWHVEERVKYVANHRAQPQHAEPKPKEDEADTEVFG